MEQTPLIVGAGPTGLSAALFLAEGGVQCRIVDKALAPSTNSRAQVINPRSLELLQQTGITDAILNEARPIHRAVFYEDWRPLAELEFGHAHPDFPMSVLPQARTEALLADALAVFGVVPERGTALGSFQQDNDGVDAVLISTDRSESFRAPIMFAADGAHANRSSEVHQSTEIDFSEDIQKLTSARAAFHQAEDKDSGMAADSAGTLVHRLSEAPRREIESLVDRLMTLHKKLQADGDRIRLDIEGYAELNRCVMQLTTIVADSVGKLPAPRIN